MQKVYLKTYSPIDRSNEVFDNIAELAKSCIEKGKFPYTKEVPLAPNRDILSNHKLNSIQAIEMELHNSLIGNDSQDWIFGANAYLLGLELKEVNKTEYEKEKALNPDFDCKPIVAYAKTMQHTKSNQITGSGETNILKEGMCIDCQTTYSLNQFSEESIKKCFTLANVKDKLLLRGDINLTDKNRTSVAQYLIKNFTSNRCSENDITHRKNIQANVISNLKSSNNDIRNKININLKECRRELNDTEKKCFDTLWNYFLKQNGYPGGIKLQNKATDNDFLKVINESGSKKFSKIMFDASSFAERLCHYGFSYEMVFTELEYKNSYENLKKGILPKYKLPEVSKKEEHIGENFISERTKQKLRSNDYKFSKENSLREIEISRA